MNEAKERRRRRNESSEQTAAGTVTTKESSQLREVPKPQPTPQPTPTHHSRAPHASTHRASPASRPYNHRQPALPRRTGTSDNLQVEVPPRARAKPPKPEQRPGLLHAQSKGQLGRASDPFGHHHQPTPTYTNHHHVPVCPCGPSPRPAPLSIPLHPSILQKSPAASPSPHDSLSRSPKHLTVIRPWRPAKLACAWVGVTNGSLIARDLGPIAGRALTSFGGLWWVGLQRVGEVQLSLAMHSHHWLRPLWPVWRARRACELSCLG